MKFVKTLSVIYSDKTVIVMLDHSIPFTLDYNHDALKSRIQIEFAKNYRNVVVLTPINDYAIYIKLLSGSLILFAEHAVSQGFLTEESDILSLPVAWIKYVQSIINIYIFVTFLYT